MLAHRSLSPPLRRRIDPADIVQVTFLEASRDLHQFRGGSSADFAAWLRGLLKNNVASAVAHHVMTQKRSTRREVSTEPAGGASSGGGWIEQLPGGRTSPSGVAVRREAVVALMEALHKLPETQAEAIRLRYMEGLSLAEIVDRIGKPDTAVAGLLKRGLQKLRTILVGENNPWIPR